MIPIQRRGMEANLEFDLIARESLSIEGLSP
jgi:hypothetical protein